MTSLTMENLVAKMPLLAGLPMMESVEHFLKLVRDNQVIIVRAETGSGKSTGLPPVLRAAGYTLLQTQPRALAAATVSARIADVLGVSLGQDVGFRSGAVKNMDGPNTGCLVATDGLAMVRRILGHERPRDILMIDEVHEWNTNIEVLVAWVKRQLAGGARFKVVLMSATLDADRLSEYFGGAPVLDLPGRIFPIEERDAGGLLERDVADLLREGRNVLVFQPGKKEIEKSIQVIENMTRGMPCVILPLHAQLSQSEQKRCFARYNVPLCIVATNVAQTSITIPGVDAVVDSGLENRLEVNNGVEGLQLRAISKACRAQRKGRAGRTGPGIFIDHCPEPDCVRPDFPVAEIQRTRLDQTVLRLLQNGVDLEELELFHPAAQGEIAEAKRILKALGCIDDHLRVTEIGKQVLRFPTDVQLARMIVEGARLGVLDDVLDIAAIMQQDGINDRESSEWLAHLGGERQSDCLAQLKLFRHAMGLSRDQMREDGIHVGRFLKVMDQRKLLQNAIPEEFEPGSNGDREKIIRSICAGMAASVFVRVGGLWVGPDGRQRQLARESVVSAAAGKVLIGKAFDIKHLKLVTMATAVPIEVLQEVAPHLAIEEAFVEPYFDDGADSVFATNRVSFGKVVLSEETVACPDHPQAAEVFARWCASRMAA